MQDEKRTDVQLLVIDAEQADQRIDNFLLARLKGVPKSRVYRLLRTGEVRVNKGRIRADYRLKQGDTVRIPPIRLARKSAAVAPGLALMRALESRIVYEDQLLLVLNKPSGVAVHGGSGLSYGIIEALRKMRPAERSLELVHRLDRETSGCLLIAKRRSALRALHRLLRDGGVDKRYQALVAGDWPRGIRKIAAPLRKNMLRSGERIVRVDPEGKSALSRVRPLMRFSRATLLEVSPVTGRTHQIRVHVAHSGHPVAGDEKYGLDEFNTRMRAWGLRRLFLHASSLKFRLPEADASLHVSAPLDADLQRILDRLAE